MTQESAPQPEGDKENKEKRKLQYSLLTLLLLVTGTSVAIALYRRQRIEAAAESLRKRFKDGTRTPIESKGLEETIAGIKEAIDNHNRTSPWYEPALSFENVVSKADLQEAAQRNARLLLERIQEDRFQINRPPRGKLDTNPGNFELVDNLRRLERILGLSQIAKISPQELLNEEPGQNVLRQEIMRQAKDMWQEVEGMTVGPNVAKRRAKERADTAFGYDVWHIDSMKENNEPWINCFKLPALVIFLNRMLALGDGEKIDKSEIGIASAEAQRILRPEIENLWQGLKKNPKPNSLELMDNQDRLLQITALMKFADLKPEDIPTIGRDRWRQVVGQTTQVKFQQLLTQIDKKTPLVQGIRTWHELHLLFQQTDPPLTPSDPAVNIPVKEWQRIQEIMEKIKLMKVPPDFIPGPGGSGGMFFTLPLNQDMTGPNSENDMDIENDLDVDPRQMNEPEEVSRSHKNFLLRTLAKMRQNALSLDTAVMAAEVAAVTVSFFAASPIFAAVSSLAVTIKLAQLTGNAINKLRGKS